MKARPAAFLVLAPFADVLADARPAALLARTSFAAVRARCALLFSQLFLQPLSDPIPPAAASLRYCLTRTRKLFLLYSLLVPFVMADFRISWLRFAFSRLRFAWVSPAVVCGAGADPGSVLY